MVIVVMISCAQGAVRLMSKAAIGAANAFATIKAIASARELNCADASMPLAAPVAQQK
jgi:hypothetical protein